MSLFIGSKIYTQNMFQTNQKFVVTHIELIPTLLLIRYMSANFLSFSRFINVEVWCSQESCLGNEAQTQTKVKGDFRTQSAKLILMNSYY